MKFVAYIETKQFWESAWSMFSLLSPSFHSVISKLIKVHWLSACRIQTQFVYHSEYFRFPTIYPQKKVPAKEFDSRPRKFYQQNWRNDKYKHDM